MTAIARSTEPSATTDGELVARAREGGARGGAAFRELYERHAGPVLGFLVKLLRDPALAEDVLQEVFFRVHRNLDRFETERSFGPWLHRITRHAALDALRVRKKETRLIDEKARGLPPAERDAVVQELAEREGTDRLARALESLPDEPRLLLVQRYHLSVPHAELAASWSVSERTLTNRIQEAAGLLARALRRTT